MNLSCLIFTRLLTIGLGIEGDPPHPILAELFTSEECTNCPSAERLLHLMEIENARDGTPIIPVAFRVDYWDGPAWGAKQLTTIPNRDDATFPHPSLGSPLSTACR